MKNLLDRFSAFFFAPRSAAGFGLMRIAWGLTALCTYVPQWFDVTRYYSSAGYLPPELEPLMLRMSERLTLLHWVTHPVAVFILYLIFLFAITLMTAGWKSRAMTVVSVLLLFSFHERNPLPLAGGDTVLRLIGFLLMISPGIEAFSIDRLRAQWRHWQLKRALLAPLAMPAWPYRLLLWQIIIIYGTSLWYKLLGDMWLSGTAVEVTLHHPIFARLPMALMDAISPFGPLVAHATLLWHVAWLLLLIPQSVAGHRLWRRLKQWLILGGLFFHSSILLLIRASTFSQSIFTGYLGLLDEHDIADLRRLINRGPTPRNIMVLYDGRCGLCLRSVFVLQLLDNLHRLQFVNFWNRSAKNAVAARVKETDLDRAMHIKQRGKFWKGFDAFRELTWHLPALWLAAPFLYIPGIPELGRKTYARIAEQRKKCNHKACPL